jgi:hypothetical protein
MREFLRDAFRNREISGRYALDEGQFFEYDDVKAVTKVGNSSRTIFASNPQRIRSYHDVTEKIKIAAGHPTYESMHEQALQLYASISKQIYGGEA